MINLQNVTVSYGKNIVYQNFSYSFNEGVNVVLGKSGCGKTTLLNVIANLVPFDGSCKVSGRTAIVFQQPSLAPVSAWKNVDLVLPRGDNSDKIQKYLRLAEISEKRDQNALTLSGGEQQRVALARAFAAEAEILLLDEPFSNLDYGVKTQLRKTLAEMLNRSEKCVVLVTHDIDDAIALADKIFLLSGNPAEIDFVANITQSRFMRSEYDEDLLSLKKRLQKMLIHSESET